MNSFADVILPLPLPNPFTYKLSEKESKVLKVGFRVAVSFGKRKIYTGIIIRLHNESPLNYEVKPIEFIYDSKSIVDQLRIDFWSWMSKYYFSPIGDILKAAVPSTLLLESESIISKIDISEEEIKNMSDNEYLIYEALELEDIRIADINLITDRKTVYPIIQKMIQSGYIELMQQIKEKYKPKLVKFIKLTSQKKSQKSIKDVLNEIKKYPKQKEILMTIIKIDKNKKTWIKLTEIKNHLSFSTSSLKSLERKKIIEIKIFKEDRNIEQNFETKKKIVLSQAQSKAVKKINSEFKKMNVVLLEGVTSSGKTEIYLNIIENYLSNNRQVLYLLPEISLTTQIIQKLKNYFGDKVSVFHSRNSIHERTEVWQNVQENKKNAQIIIGARSSLFLPFKNLGLIIIDEEHENSYKQQEPSPRYHARDSAIILSRLHKSKIILGSATPSIESSKNARNGKYGWVKLNERYGGIKMPKIETIDIKEEILNDKMDGLFSKKLIDEIGNTLKEKKQVILFRNRRGYASIWMCNTCGYHINCDNCDVTLTFHNVSNNLKCHYCGFTIKTPKICSTCGVESMINKGDGTQQIEESIKEYFPKAKVNRMDWDTTRGKWSFDKIINSFADHEIDILIGTQMVTKGLDFNNVKLVGVLNTDHFLNFPNFRAHEKAFQVLTQVAGRAGRKETQGKVLLQTYQPNHPIIQYVINNDYKSMFEAQLVERIEYKYPPYVRLIKLTIKDKSHDKVNIACEWLDKMMRRSYKGDILGPVYPEISRVRNKYQKQFIVKLKNIDSINQFRSILNKTLISFDSISKYRSVRVIVDVDPL
jgi:primosomal protein N' (replication factor Y)